MGIMTSFLLHMPSLNVYPSWVAAPSPKGSKVRCGVDKAKHSPHPSPSVVAGHSACLRDSLPGHLAFLSLGEHWRRPQHFTAQPRYCQLSDDHNPAPLSVCGRFGNSLGVPHPCPQDPGAAGPGGCPCDSPKPTSRAPRTSCSIVYLSTHLAFLLARWHSEFSYLLAFAHAVPTAQHAFSCLGLSTCQGALPHPKLAQGLHFPRKRCLAHYTLTSCLSVLPSIR